MSTRELQSRAMKLSPRKRAALAERLLRSLDSDARRSIDGEWAREAEDRIDAYERGELKSKPLSKVLANLNRRKKR